MSPPVAFHVRFALAAALGLGVATGAGAWATAGPEAVLGVAVGVCAMMGAVGAAAAHSQAILTRAPRRARLLGGAANLGLVAVAGLVFWVVTRFGDAPAWSLAAGVTAGVCGMLVGFSARYRERG